MKPTQFYTVEFGIRRIPAWALPVVFLFGPPVAAFYTAWLVAEHMADVLRSR